MDNNSTIPKDTIETCSFLDISKDTHERESLSSKIPSGIRDKIKTIHSWKNINDIDQSIVAKYKKQLQLFFYIYPTSLFLWFLDTILESYKLHENKFIRKIQSIKIDSLIEFKNTYSQSLRQQNIALINSYQDRILQQSDFNIQQKLCDPRDRALIVYYRWSQMESSSCDLAQSIIYLVKKYVEWWHSRIFNKFYIVYRYNEKDFLPEFAENSVFPTRMAFEIFTALYANTIHLSEGTPNFLPGTLPILANGTIINVDGSTACNEQYEKLSLSFINNERDKYLTVPSLPPIEFKKNPKDPFVVTLNAIERCEGRMLQQARDFHKNKEKLQK